MTDWTQAEHTAVRQFIHSENILKHAIARYCEERTRASRSESGAALLSTPRNVDGAVNAAVEAQTYESFLQRLKAELASYERAAAALVSSAEPTREEEQVSGS